MLLLFFHPLKIFSFGNPPVPNSLFSLYSFEQAIQKINVYLSVAVKMNHFMMEDWAISPSYGSKNTASYYHHSLTSIRPSMSV